jgi:hypothetical protein
MAWSMWPKDTGLGVNMNELISKLFKQSGGSIEIENGNFWTYTTENYDPELFATLIIRECANQVDWILAEGGKTQGDLIKQHFGVEE